MQVEKACKPVGTTTHIEGFTYNFTVSNMGKRCIQMTAMHGKMRKVTKRDKVQLGLKERREV